MSRLARRTVIILGSIALLSLLAESALGVGQTNNPTKDRLASTGRGPDMCDVGRKVLSRRVGRFAPRREGMRRHARLPVAAPNCGGGDPCRWVDTGTSLEGNWVSTSVLFCWNGSAVTYIWPTGGSTSAGAGESFYLQDWDRWSYCCVGHWEWHMDKIANFTIVTSRLTWRHDCLRNELHLYGNGTYSTNPGWWFRWTAFTDLTDCAAGPG
jgi:hypothetical protein